MAAQLGKTLLIAISKNEKDGLFQGIVYDPTEICTLLKGIDEYKAFFSTEKQFYHFSLNTPMVVGRLAEELATKLGGKVDFGVANSIRNFSLKSVAGIEKMKFVFGELG